MIRYNVPVIGDRSGFQEIDFELEKGIIGEVDNRAPVRDTKAAPYRFVCHLEIRQTGSDGSSRTTFGTGTLISNRHVLTCGHNIRDRAGRVIYNAQRVAVTPGKNTSREQTFADRMSWTPFGSHITTNCAPHPQWRDHFNHHYDYGLITLPNDIGSKKFGFLNNRRLGYWGSAAEGGGTVLAAIDPETIRNKVVYVCGYPNDKCGDKPYNGVTCPKGQRGGTQFLAFDKVLDPRPPTEHRLLYHHADAKFGQSGGPIWRQEGNRWHFVGIESSSESTFGQYTLHNVGVRITTELLNELRNVLGWRV